MFTRSVYQTPDMSEQHRILEQISTLVDEGLVRTTLGTVAGRITAENLRKAHAAIESHKSIGNLSSKGSNRSAKSFGRFEPSVPCIFEGSFCL